MSILLNWVSETNVMSKPGVTGSKGTGYLVHIYIYCLFMYTNVYIYTYI